MRPLDLKLTDDDWKAQRRGLQTWVDRVQGILTRGFVVADQVGDVYSLTWSGSAIGIPATFRQRPAAVVALTAEDTTNPGVYLSPCPVSWRWDGMAVSILSAPMLTGAGPYTLRISVVP